MRILVLNSGSSSIKYKLFDSNLTVLVSDTIDRIGERKSPYQNHQEAIDIIIDKLIKEIDKIEIVVHRVVHGGLRFIEPVLIDLNVIQEIKKTIPLAPLHNRANLLGIQAMQKALPNSKHIAFFDTAFHQSMPELSYRYAIGGSFDIRRFGFHGISHQYLLKETAKLLDKDIEKLNIITIHLGNGCSITAIKNGKSFKTSMGFTPLEGLIMGSRSGDIDAGIIFYLAREKGLSIDEIDSLLNKKSGLKGLSGSNDMRDIINNMNSGDSKAKFAFELFCIRIKEYIGRYMAIIGEIEAIVFSGGIGANSFEVREEVCKDLEHFGILIDKEKNKNNKIEINQSNSIIKIFAIETDEELEMARESLKYR